MGILYYFATFGAWKQNLFSYTMDINKSVDQIIFGETVTFNYSDFENLGANTSYDRYEIGNLYVSSGKIVCADPLYRALGFPQNWSVKPELYPVCIYIGMEADFKGRIAYAEVVFSKKESVRWEMSLIDDGYLEDEFDKKINGLYPVENGLGSFSDFATWDKYNQKIKDFYNTNAEGNFYTAVLEPLFKQSANIPNSSRGEDWANFLVDEKTTENIILFGSGGGDGLYPRYVAYDKDNQIVKLITDFIQLEYAENER